MNLRIPEAARRTGLSEGYLYRLIRDGKLAAVRIPVGAFQEVWAIPVAVVEQLEERMRSAGSGDAA